MCHKITSGGAVSLGTAAGTMSNKEGMIFEENNCGKVA